MGEVLAVAVPRNVILAVDVDVMHCFVIPGALQGKPPLSVSS